MKYLQLIWLGIWRKPGRTVLIFLQVSVSIALFGVLQGMKTGVEHAVAAARGDLLIVHSRENFLATPLPLGMLDQIRSVPGVKVAIPVDLGAATYQKPDQKLGVVSVRPDKDWLTAFTYSMAPEYALALQKLRTGVLVRDLVVQRYGWKVGTRVPLNSFTAQQNGSTDWVFQDVGSFTDSDIGGGRDIVLINYDYLNEARLTGKDTVNHFNVSVLDPRLANTVADEIDRRFANSSNETRTESLLEMAQQQEQSIGDLNFLIRAVVGAVLVALLFATTTMMMQSIRERTPELAVLKTVGFSNRAVFLLVLAEALTVCVAAAGLGVALANLAFPFAARFVHGLSMPAVVIGAGLGLGALVALVSAAVPAALAARVQVAAALSGR
ncbi:MAG TPA: ABC transporter permease [Steroidobacteraceae bacterium]|nr:ABC transporter permease [Steroidobacteraceae bacterium]